MSAWKLILLGSSLTLVVVGAIFGLWSMTIAPPPPAVAAARNQLTRTQLRLDDAKDEFRIHIGRANTAYAIGKPERALIHAVVAQEATDVLLRGELAALLDAEERAAISDELCKTVKFALSTGGTHPLVETVIAGDTACKPSLRVVTAAVP